jgi:hypothetical protein
VTNKLGDYIYNHIWLEFAGKEAILHKSSGYDTWEDGSTSDFNNKWEMKLPKDKMESYLVELIDKGEIMTEQVNIKENCSGREPYQTRQSCERKYITAINLKLEKKGKENEEFVLSVANPFEITSMNQLYSKVE